LEGFVLVELVYCSQIICSQIIFITISIDSNGQTTMTIEYKAPIDDMRFILQDVLKLADRDDLYGDFDMSGDITDAVLVEMSKFSERVILPLNASGDQEGCQLVDNQVITPKGFKEAYKHFAEGGWIGMTAKPEHGGQGLPHVLHTCVGEMVTAANPSFGMYTGMNKGAIEALKAAANPDLQATYLPKLVSGEWAATMNLTEPHAGTDLGLLRTKATVQSNGSYRITGSKIFISSGDHNFTSNIIHLVLARTPDAPAGSKGISLFVVPKFMVNADGSLGARNHVQCTSLEKKMGLKGSATCSMSFDDATGFLIGTENAGLRAMFSMMNIMRIAVGGQAVSLSDIAYQNASRYSKERLQGRGPGSTATAGQADPLVRIPDVRRMLMASRSFAECGRAFTLWLSMQLDIAETSTNAGERKKAHQLLGLLTPVLKGYLTETAEEVISMSLQCFGGHGYITETGIEQIYRDARISKIYEGATGVQAIDLLGRKVLLDGGKALNLFIKQLNKQCELCTQHDSLIPFAKAVQLAVQDLEDATQWIVAHAGNDQNLAGAVSHHYLNLMGLVTTGYMWCLMASAAKEKLENGQGNSVFLQNKLDTGYFYMAQYMPDSSSLVKKIKSGAAAVMAINEVDI
jgi:3-(methylsulfanyl)propanoyl-CoA dehydrogenase